MSDKPLPTEEYLLTLQPSTEGIKKNIKTRKLTEA